VPEGWTSSRWTDQAHLAPLRPSAKRIDLDIVWPQENGLHPTTDSILSAVALQATSLPEAVVGPEEQTTVGDRPARKLTWTYRGVDGTPLRRMHWVIEEDKDTFLHVSCMAKVTDDTPECLRLLATIETDSQKDGQR